MSYPPPPGLKTWNSSAASTPQPHPSLPARPPATAGAFKPAFTSLASNGPPGTGAFSAFKPRAVGYPTSSASPSVLAGPAPPSNYPGVSSTHQSAGYQQSQQQGSQTHQGYYAPQPSESYAQPTPPQIRNPFPLPGQASYGGGDGGSDWFGNVSYDPEQEAQIAQWQSAYASKDESTGQRSASGANSAGGANAIALGPRPPAITPLTSSELASAVKGDTGVAAVVAGPDGKQKTVVRSGGGKTWQDPSLLEWDPAHFRLFVGNLAGEVTDESLHKAFSKYSSIQKARVIRDKRTTKSAGYGFVSFSNGDDYFQAAKDMQGKYIGSHPVLIKRSTTEIRPTNPVDKSKNKKYNKGGNNGGNGGQANTGAGVQKKSTKTKGGLKILG